MLQQIIGDIGLVDLPTKARRLFDRGSGDAALLRLATVGALKIVSPRRF